MKNVHFAQDQLPEKPWVIAGPCMAESAGLLDEVASFLAPLAKELDFELIFKASFDKANRTSISSDRGPGLAKVAQWFGDIHAKYELPILTDIHECEQVAQAAECSTVLQIPAFLCRQTDLLVAAVKSGCAVNVKKGQFLAPEGVAHIVSKAKAAAEEAGLPANVAVTERGSSFGYGDLIVDMRGFATMASFGAPLIFDITHSMQKPGTGGGDGSVSGGARQFAGALARAAAATGHLSGFFLEVHSSPDQAMSDAATQLNFQQAEALLRQIIPLWKHCRPMAAKDRIFSRS